MDLSDFRESVADAVALLKGVQTIIPARVDQKLITFLETAQKDDVALELLRNAIKPKA